MATGRGICGIGFAAETGRAAAFADLARHWPRARLIEAPGRLRPWAAAAFDGAPDAAHGVPLALTGAPFQIEVWTALRAIPPGRVATYSAIAAAVGRPRAVRAVGRTIGRNPVAWLVPCHRVLRASGGLGGYRWGLGVKRAMLAWEAARAGAGPADAAGAGGREVA
jgi:AraC family transcriptional regulator of adaptative response/methylated-DNA-[protein]-cysteine methyltransferase